ncbi:hypothetical protein INT45_000423 [Circinella minor]|uniref:Uncharacterized protein n=1 Tax=Circinella minor TaxID=1195481 RepID=A0A8H7RWI7_9FUNG|nr:hypothetical protein INT45_000423 [Circinella minor]
MEDKYLMKPPTPSGASLSASALSTSIIAALSSSSLSSSRTSAALSSSSVEDKLNFYTSTYISDELP